VEGLHPRKQRIARRAVVGTPDLEQFAAELIEIEMVVSGRIRVRRTRER
jgi:hypothetical protein